MKKKSVQSKNPCKSLPCRQAGVIQTNYDIVKAHGGELDIQSQPDSTIFKIHLSL
jgi:hypothetical protein